METQQLLKTRLELAFSPANGFTPKERCSYELQAFISASVRACDSGSRLKNTSCEGFFFGGGELHVKADDTLRGPWW